MIAVAPALVAVFVTAQMIGGSVPWLNLLLLTVFYFVIAHGVTIGFHRLFTHRSFEACRPLKVTLALLGSMSFQGSVIGWVADHRRHHRFADRPGDPHSPLYRGAEHLSQLRGFIHTHAGWVFSNPATPPAEFAPDMLADPDLVLIDKLFVPCCIATPRVAVRHRVRVDRHARRRHRRTGVGGHHPHQRGPQHHVGDQLGVPPVRETTVPHATRAPTSARSRCSPAARRGTTRTTPSRRWPGTEWTAVRSTRRALLIRLFERLGWVWNVRWPNPLLLDARRV